MASVRIEITAESGAEARRHAFDMFNPPAMFHLTEEQAREIAEAPMTGGRLAQLPTIAESPLPILATEPVGQGDVGAAGPTGETRASDSVTDQNSAEKELAAVEPALAAKPRGRGRPKKGETIPPVSANAPEPADGAGVSVAADPSTGSGEPITTTQSSAAAAESLAPAASAPPAAAEPTHDQAREALRGYAGVHGYEAAVALLAKFGAGEILEVKPADLGAFIKACA